MDILNLKVIHNVFGKGIVTEFDGKYAKIKFMVKSCKFVYPDAFEKFIKAEDSSIQEAIMNEISDIKQADKEKCQVEIEARQVEEKIRITERKAVSSKKKLRDIDDGFGVDYNVEYLAKHPILTYNQVEERFGIKISGFGRGINRTSSALVLISSIDVKKSGFVYHDHWTTDGDYIYSGEGKTGDQKMTLGNKAIVDSEQDGKRIHLFVKFSPQEYYYQGIFCLVDYIYEDDKDELGNVRKEYKFKLRKQNIEE